MGSDQQEPSSVGRASLPARTTEPFAIYRRRLPHWRLTGATYFVTWRLHETQETLAPGERAVIVSALRYFDHQRYELFAYVVMDDHVHVLVKPLAQHRLQDILHSWKSYTARQLQREHGRHGGVWQEEYFDRVVRDDEEFLEKAEYIVNNPLKRWPECESYPWVWSIGF